MNMPVSRSSTNSDIILFLREHNLEEIVSEFETNEVDGEDFFDLEYSDIYSMIPRLKLRKKFIKAWSEATLMTFDHNNKRIPTSDEDGIKETSFGNENNESSSPIPIQNCSVASTPEVSQIRSTSTPINSSTGSRKRTCGSPVPVAKIVKTLVVNNIRIPSDDEEVIEPSLSSENSSNSTQYGLVITPEVTTVKETSVDCSAKEKQHWLTDFVLPSRWEADVEEGLKKQQLNPSQRNALVRQLCSSLLAKADTISASERNHIALLIIQRYPFLKGSYGAGQQVWAKKIEERILNVKRKAARHRRKELEDSGMQIIKQKPGRKGKGKKKVEMPSFPTEETRESLEEHSKQLLMLTKDKPYDVHKVRNLMDITYPLRRRQIVTENKRVWQVIKDYPCLTENKGAELKAELSRILGRDNVVKQIRDQWTSKRASILNALKKTKIAAVESKLMALDDVDGCDEREMENRVIFAALPSALGEKSKGKFEAGDCFWKIITDDSKVTAEEVVNTCTSPMLLSCGCIESMTSISIIGEGMVITTVKPPNILNAVVLLLTMFYTFNCEYPKGLSKNIFNFLDFILLNSTEPLPVGVDNFLSLM